MVDDKHPVIVHAEAFGASQEHDLLEPMVEGSQENFEQPVKKEILENATLVADSGYHSEANVKMTMEEGIDAYIADPQFRKRDPRFTQVDRYKERFRKEQRALTGFADRYWPNRDFTMSEDQRY